MGGVRPLLASALWDYLPPASSLRPIEWRMACYGICHLDTPSIRRQFSTNIGEGTAQNPCEWVEVSRRTL